MAGVLGCDLISKYRDICASFQWAVLKHMAKTLHRALLFCDMKQLLPEHKTVVSFLFVFLAFDFCRFCVVIRFFSFPPQRPMTSDFEGYLHQILSITLFSNLTS